MKPNATTADGKAKLVDLSLDGDNGSVNGLTEQQLNSAVIVRDINNMGWFISAKMVIKTR